MRDLWIKKGVNDETKLFKFVDFEDYLVDQSGLRKFCLDFLDSLAKILMIMS